MIPAQLLTLTLYMCTFIHTKFLCVYSSAAFKSSLSQSRCSSEPKHFHRRVHPPPKKKPNSIDACYACFPAGHNKMT